MPERRKLCPVCNTEKSADAFYQRKDRGEALASLCKVCHKTKYLPPKPKPLPRPCVMCGSEFTPAMQDRARFCSQACGALARKVANGWQPRPPAVVDGQRKCTACGKVKPIDAFTIRTRRNGQPTPRCKECAAAQARARGQSDAGRRARYKAKYGVSLEWYEATLAEQDEVCAICKRPEMGARRYRLNIDHCHSGGIVRGLLCWTCNAALGHMQDNRDWLREAIAYLDRAETRTHEAYDRLAEQYADTEIPQWSLDYIDRVLRGEQVDDDHLQKNGGALVLSDKDDAPHSRENRRENRRALTVEAAKDELIAPVWLLKWLIERKPGA